MTCTYTATRLGACKSCTGTWYVFLEPQNPKTSDPPSAASPSKQRMMMKSAGSRDSQVTLPIGSEAEVFYRLETFRAPIAWQGRGGGGKKSSYIQPVKSEKHSIHHGENVSCPAHSLMRLARQKNVVSSPIQCFQGAVETQDGARPASEVKRKRHSLHDRRTSFIRSALLEVSEALRGERIICIRSAARQALRNMAMGHVCPVCQLAKVLKARREKPKLHLWYAEMIEACGQKITSDFESNIRNHARLPNRYLSNRNLKETVLFVLLRGWHCSRARWPTEQRRSHPSVRM